MSCGMPPERESPGRNRYEVVDPIFNKYSYSSFLSSCGK